VGSLWSVEALREAEHPAGFGMATVVGIEVTKPDAVKPVGVLQQPDQVSMRVVRFWFALAVHGERRLDRGEIVSLNTAAHEQCQHFGKSGQSRPGVAGVAGAMSIVPTCDVVKMHRGPQPGRFLDQAGGGDQTKRVDKHASDMRLPVQRARMSKQLRRRDKVGVCDGNQGSYGNHRNQQGRAAQLALHEENKRYMVRQ
jgi:hypothetical protein